MAGSLQRAWATLTHSLAVPQARPYLPASHEDMEVAPSFLHSLWWS
jgi:hypothetical protein